jgi:hypothetical protein
MKRPYVTYVIPRAKADTWSVALLFTPIPLNILTIRDGIVFGRFRVRSLSYDFRNQDAELIPSLYNNTVTCMSDYRRGLDW